MISQIFMQTCDTSRRCKHLPVAVKVTAKKEFTLLANDQVEVSTISCRLLPKMLHAFNQRNGVFEVLIRKDLTIARNGCVYKNNTRQYLRASRIEFRVETVNLHLHDTVAQYLYMSKLCS